MKIRTTKYIIKEGIQNAYRNKLMSLASVSIVAATLVIFGLFLLITINLNENTKVLKEQTQMVAFCDYKLDDTQVKKVEEEIKANENVLEYKLVSRAQALDIMKKSLGDEASVLEGEDESIMPVSFEIKLRDAAKSSVSMEEIKKISGVNKVRFPQKYIDTISKIINLIRLFSSILIIVLLIVSIFIISNTIKLTVFARRKEISIMKYIGSTDWFIRWPFIVEGVIIGCIGAIIAFIFIYYSYGSFANYANDELSRESIDVFKLIRAHDIGIQIMAIYLLIGSTIGSLGSLISIRKYLRV